MKTAKEIIIYELVQTCWDADYKERDRFADDLLRALEAGGYKIMKAEES